MEEQRPSAADRERLSSLADEESRERLFAERPHLISTATVRWASGEVGRQVRVDVDRAEQIAITARWLAERLADEAGLARSCRATGNVRLYRRDYPGALSAYEEALAGFERLGDAEEAAVTRSSMIGSLSHLGRYERAVECAAAARATFERLGDKLRLARLENNLAHIQTRQDRFPEALDHYRTAHRLLLEVGQPSDVATTLRNIAVCHQDLNDLSSSLAAYREARAYCREHGLTQIGLEVEYNIAYLYYLRGEYTRAIALFEAARRDCEVHGDPHHKAVCDLDLAEIFLELNLATDAVRLAERGYEAFRELGIEYDMGKALAYQALAAQRLGDPDRAGPLLERARRIFVRQENRVWTGMVDLYAALGSSSAGRLDEATRLAEAALGSFVDSGVPSRTALCEVLLARLALSRGDLARTRALCDSALARVEAVGLPILEFQVHLVSGLVEEVAGDRTAALAAYRRAEAALERMRARLATDELKIAFGGDKQAVYEGLVTITLLEGDDGGDGSRRAAFRYVERAKSRSLADLLAFGACELRPVAPGQAELDGKIRAAREELNWLYRQLDAEELKGREKSLEAIERLRRECARREQTLLRHLRRLQNADAELGSLQAAAVAEAGTVAAALPDETVLVEYYIARGVVYAFVLDRRRLLVRRLTAAAEISELFHQLRLQLDKFRIGPEYVARFGEILERSTLTLLAGLHERLLAPIVDELEGRHLIVVPHDFLHNLPFHALHDGEAFVIDRFSVSYAPSATVLHLCSQRQARPANRSLVLGVPDERAPMILEEVQTVAAVLPNARLLIGPQATPEALSRLAADCRIVHLATHGLHRRDNPMFSAIRLGDSRLSLFDLYGIRLQAELAVLSGCGTGLAAVQGADELVGLTRGLLYAGARSVMATLWDVNDESTADFMAGFYRHLLASGRPSRALRRAQRELRESYSHPYYWAPFLLVGKPH